VVGERGVLLSGGQKQRVAVARAFLRQAPILILDEATSALDSQSELMIQEALRQLVVGKTVIIIAHRFSTIRDASLILVFDRGEIVAQGNHASLYAGNRSTNRSTTGSTARPARRDGSPAAGSFLVRFMAPTPRVSVLIPTYNYGRYLPEAIESVLAQEFGDFELILSDDASTDGSADIVHRYAGRDARIRACVRPATSAWSPTGTGAYAKRAAST